MQCSLNHNSKPIFVSMSNGFFTRVYNWWTERRISRIDIDSRCRQTELKCNHDVTIYYYGGETQTKLFSGEYIYISHYSEIPYHLKDHFHDLMYPKKTKPPSPPAYTDSTSDKQ